MKKRSSRNHSDTWYEHKIRALELELAKAQVTIGELKQLDVSHVCNECSAARIDELRGIIKQLEADKETWISQISRYKIDIKECQERLIRIGNESAPILEFRNQLISFLNLRQLHD